MAQPTCPSCGNRNFTLEEMNVSKAGFKIYGICCSNCGVVVGTQEYYNIGALIFKLANKLNVKLV